MEQLRIPLPVVMKQEIRQMARFSGTVKEVLDRNFFHKNMGASFGRATGAKANSLGISWPVTSM